MYTKKIVHIIFKESITQKSRLKTLLKSFLQRIQPKLTHNKNTLFFLIKKPFHL